MSVMAQAIPTALRVGSSAAFLATAAFPQTSGGTAPDGLSVGDPAEIRVACESGRLVARPVEGGYEVSNPRQAWRSRFDGRGFLVVPDEGGWTWGLELLGYGFAGVEQRVTSPVCVSADGGRVFYAWGADLEEWFANDMRGLEHGYTVHRRPARGGPLAEGPLILELAVRGGLRPETTGEGRDVRFLDERGSVVLTYTGLLVTDSEGRDLDAGFECTGDTLLLSVDERGARYPLRIDPVAQQAYLKASNTDAQDFFGYSVGVSGDTAVIGAVWESSGATGVDGNEADNSVLRAGAAYVFVRNGGTWSQQAYLKASNTDSHDEFGTSVAISGDTVVIGADHEDANATGVNGNQSDNSAGEAGAAYVFVRSGPAWSQQAYLKASNTGTDDRFGFSVAVSGDTVVVGAPNESSSATGVNGNQSDNGAQSAGAAYVFARNGTNWSQQAYLKASNTDMQDGFGWTVAVSGDTVVIGSRGEDSAATGVNGNQADNGTTDSGAAYVFVRNGTTWTQEAYVKASNTDVDDRFGNSVTVSGDTAVVGSAMEDSSATGVDGNQGDNSTTNAGAAYVFVRNGTAWSQQAYLKASNTGLVDDFGNAVSLSGDELAVGAVFEDSDADGVDGDQSDNTAPASGAVYAFVRNGTTWSQDAYLKASNSDSGDQFGHSVSVSGGTLIVGAWHEASNATGVNGDQGDNGSMWAGAAYAFGDGLGTSYCTAGPNSTGAPAGISASGSASVATNDLVLSAEPVPNQPGVFFYGPMQTSVPFGNGTLCVTGQIGRLDVVNASGNVMTFLVDNTNPPSAATQITPGSTWNFQAWFRDPAAGGAFFDLSDGLNVVFGP